MWELTNYIANKDYEGNVISPEDFKRLAKVANIDLLKIKMGLPEDFMLGQPLTRQHFDANKNMTNDTRFLRTRHTNDAIANGRWVYPGNYLVIDTMRHKVSKTIDGAAQDIWRRIDPVTESKLTDRLSSYIKKPTLWDPVRVMRADAIYVYPETITTAEVIYVRYPTSPNFTYIAEQGYITQGPNPTEFEWGANLHNDLMRIILGYIGINIRDQVLLGYAEQKKQEGV